MNSLCIYSTEEIVRINDINFGNHLGHNKLVELLHNARATFLDKFGFSELNCFGFALILLNLNVSYKSQAYFNEHLFINLSIKINSNSRFSFLYTVTNSTKNKLVATAETEMAFFNFSTQKIIRIPAEFKVLIRQQIQER